jgi:toxin secretion/phage lysis holin
MDEITNIIEHVSFRDDYWMMLIPVILMGADVLTGIVQAWATGHLKSYKMREGLGRKFGEVMILFIVRLFTVGMILPKSFLPGVAIYIVFMELLSICENLKKLGVPMPKWFDRALEKANDIIQNGSKDETNEEVKPDGDKQSKT